MHGRLLAYVLIAVLAPALALAAPITSLVVVGDSLSDQGNGFILTGGTFPPPPYDQRASNGPVAVEYLASALGVPLTPSGAGGTNYAVLGAATGAVGIPSLPPLTTENSAALLYGQAALEGTSLLTQTGVILGLGPVADPNALFFVWGGANDLFINPSAATLGDAVNNLAAIISMLYGSGARQFLVPNLPDLSLTPYGLSLSPADKAGLAGALNRLQRGSGWCSDRPLLPARYRHRAVRHLQSVQCDSGESGCVRLQHHLDAVCYREPPGRRHGLRRRELVRVLGLGHTRPPPRIRCSAMPSPLQWRNRSLNRSRNRPRLRCSASVWVWLWRHAAGARRSFSATVRNQHRPRPNLRVSLGGLDQNSDDRWS